MQELRFAPPSAPHYLHKYLRASVTGCLATSCPTNRGAANLRTGGTLADSLAERTEPSLFGLSSTRKTYTFDHQAC